MLIFTTTGPTGRLVLIKPTPPDSGSFLFLTQGYGFISGGVQSDLKTRSFKVCFDRRLKHV